MYAKMALIELATEFRVMAEHSEREAARREADRIRAKGRFFSAQSPIQLIGQRRRCSDFSTTQGVVENGCALIVFGSNYRNQGNLFSVVEPSSRLQEK